MLDLFPNLSHNDDDAPLMASDDIGLDILKVCQQRHVLLSLPTCTGRRTSVSARPAKQCMPRSPAEQAAKEKTKSRRATEGAPPPVVVEGYNVVLAIGVLFPPVRRSGRAAEEQPNKPPTKVPKSEAPKAKTRAKDPDDEDSTACPCADTQVMRELLYPSMRAAIAARLRVGGSGPGSVALGARTAG